MLEELHKLIYKGRDSRNSIRERLLNSRYGDNCEVRGRSLNYVSGPCFPIPLERSKERQAARIRVFALTKLIESEAQLRESPGEGASVTQGASPNALALCRRTKP
jgi:hypothetical protein